MELRRLVRGRVDWPDIERVVRELADRYDRDEMRVRFLDADNWLSTPMVIDDDLFVKVITRQNTIVHALFTTGRNLGVFSAGTEGFFERYETPYEMALHELEATQKVRDRRQRPGRRLGPGGRRPRRRRIGVPPRVSDARRARRRRRGGARPPTVRDPPDDPRRRARARRSPRGERPGARRRPLRHRRDERERGGSRVGAVVRPSRALSPRWNP